MSAEQCRQLDDNNLECCDGDLCNKGECYGSRSSLLFIRRISAQYINLSMEFLLLWNRVTKIILYATCNNNNNNNLFNHVIVYLRMKFGEITVHMQCIKTCQGSGKLCDMTTSSDV